jgi:hypothetical protein
MLCRRLPQILERAWAQALPGREAVERDAPLRAVHRLLSERFIPPVQMPLLPKPFRLRLVSASRQVSRN